MKTKQNDSPEVHYANCNAKNVRKVLVNHFDSSRVIILSCEDKYIVKIGSLGCPLALFPKTKAGQVAQEVDVIAGDNDTITKSKLVPTVVFDTDAPNNPNLGSFFQCRCSCWS